jgi:HEAT repeat protein
VSLVVEEPNPRGNGLLEVHIVTDVDEGGGVGALVADVAEMKPGADASARVLAGRGVEAARSVAAALPTSPPEGRRRLVQLLARMSTADAAAAKIIAPALGQALSTAQAEDRPMIVEALERLGAAGVEEARRLYGDPTQSVDARADAAQVLGASATPSGLALEALLAGAGRGEPSLRAATQAALAKAAAADAAAAAALARALSQTGAGEAARIGDLARALAKGARKSEASTAAARAISAAWSAAPADGFALRVRLVRAAGELGDASLLAALEEAARDRDPVLRRTAAAAAVDVPGGAALLERAAADEDAGVRRAAVSALAQRLEPASARMLEHALVQDHWPMVRRAAAEGLGGGCARGLWHAPPALARAIVGHGDKLAGADPAEEVRRAALAALGRCPDAPASTLRAILRERRQPIGVRELAAALVAKQGGPEAARALADALQELLSDPNADERTAALAAACTRALGRTGDQSRPVLEALGAAANEPMSAQVRAAAMEAIGALCPAGAHPALDKGTRDPDGFVVRAARTALTRCSR